MPGIVIPYTRLRRGKLYLNLPIPADLRPRFVTANGKPRTHIVEALGTGDALQGRRIAREKQAHWELHFAKLRRGHAGELPSALRKAEELREAIREARERNDEGTALFEMESRAVDEARRIEEQAGPEAASGWLDLATKPERMTLKQALKGMCESPDMTEGTKAKRTQQLAELLAFLKVEDCLPEFVTDVRAVAYVDHLNAKPLGYSTKQDRLSGLHTVWRYLVKKRQVSKDASPWRNRELTGKKKGGQNGEGDKRAWTTDETLKLLKASEPPRTKHYTRALLRELYTLGFITGMRLDEIVSIRPRAVETIKGGYWIKVEESKTDAGRRSIPIVHPAAVAILRKRLAKQKDAGASIFPECRPGGPDNKLSWHVQKALGRDRDALGFGAEVDFHSTRRNFMTLMENNGSDTVHAQRYVGHNVPSLMHRVYSEGASRENLRKVAAAVKYPAKVEAEFRRAAGL